VTIPRILVAESAGFAERAVHILSDVGTVALADLNRRDLLAALGGVSVLWVRLRHRIDAEVLAAAPALTLIVTATTGLNHIDLDEAERRGVGVMSLRGETAFLEGVAATAEHTLALSLALLRRLPAAAGHVLSGGWDRDRFKGSEICGKTVGVVGYGRLGRIVARYFSALGAAVLACDPAIDESNPPPGVESVRLPELLARADLVTVHANLHAGNAGFFGWPEFGAMKRGAWFVNTARGELVDEAALLDALRSGRIAGAALDVLCAEHDAAIGERALVRYARDHDNLIITPHIGGCTPESMQKTEIFLATRVGDLLGRQTPKRGEREPEIACAE
jgi:D-3-phosphoglycerate dehydrogenase